MSEQLHLFDQNIALELTPEKLLVAKAQQLFSTEKYYELCRLLIDSRLPESLFQVLQQILDDPQKSRLFFRRSDDDDDDYLDYSVVLQEIERIFEFAKRSEHTSLQKTCRAFLTDTIHALQFDSFDIPELQRTMKRLPKAEESIRFWSYISERRFRLAEEFSDGCVKLPDDASYVYDTTSISNSVSSCLLNEEPEVALLILPFSKEKLVSNLTALKSQVESRRPKDPEKHMKCQVIIDSMLVLRRAGLPHDLTKYLVDDPTLFGAVESKVIKTREDFEALYQSSKTTKKSEKRL